MPQGPHFRVLRAPEEEEERPTSSNQPESRTAFLPETEKLCNLEVSLPQCTYTNVFLAVHEFKDWLLVKNKGSHGLTVTLFFGSLLPAVLLFSLSVTAQVAITYYVSQELKDADPCEVKSNLLIQWTGLALFIGTMIQETSETISIGWWMIVSDAVSKDIEGDVAEPLTIPDKVAGIVLVVIPKLLIGLWLTWVGSEFVLLSPSDTDLVMNCLAMTFVVEIDELVHSTATNHYGRKMAEKLMPATTNNETAFFLDMALAVPMKLLVWGGTVFYFKETMPVC